ncbi:hypothetical protein BGW37DRAFT_505457 [Umbelopsis sp. PMI_123]|nr:hypothetical protein BGW37DRAFT_505457 [Umbelopsis sp. PMI_123]
MRNCTDKMVMSPVGGTMCFECLFFFSLYDSLLFQALAVNSGRVIGIPSILLFDNVCTWLFSVTRQETM